MLIHAPKPAPRRPGRLLTPSLSAQPPSSDGELDQVLLPPLDLSPHPLVPEHQPRLEEGVGPRDLARHLQVLRDEVAHRQRVGDGERPPQEGFGEGASGAVGPAPRPAWLAFIRRSPMNMVAALEAKSDPTIDRAAAASPAKRRAVRNVTHPATTRHMRALTRDRVVVSENRGASSPRPLPERYRRFVAWIFSSSARAASSWAVYFCCLFSNRWIFWSIWRIRASWVLLLLSPSSSAARRRTGPGCDLGRRRDDENVLALKPGTAPSLRTHAATRQRRRECVMTGVDGERKSVVFSSLATQIGASPDAKDVGWTQRMAEERKQLASWWW